MRATTRSTTLATLEIALSLPVLAGGGCPADPVPDPIPKPVDLSPDDPDKTEPGQPGGGNLDDDTDGNDTDGCNDPGPGDLADTSVAINTVPVGNAGNADDTGGYGGVAYVYNIGTYEATAGQYTAFLNKVASADTYNLYNWLM
jgi:hypothetical protein